MSIAAKSRRHRKLRRKLGKCGACNRKPEINPRTQKPFFYCEHHRETYQKRMNRLRSQQRQQWRDNGNCARCGEPCQINRLKGKPYRLCMKHRLADTVAQKAYYQRRHGSIPSPV